MNEPFNFYILIIPYLAWSVVYFFKNLFPAKKWMKSRFRTLYVICLIFFLVSTMLRYHSEQLSVNSIQIFVILVAFICFEGSIGKKISGYLFFEIMAVTIEAISTSLYIILRNFVALEKITYFELSYQLNIIDIVATSLLMIPVGILFYRQEVRVLKKCFSYLNVWTFFQLLLPLIVPILAQGIILNQVGNPQFLTVSVIFWFLCIITYPLFLLGVRTLRKQERKHAFQTQQLLIMKEQLAFSKQSEQEYAALRKWNHDSENHLLSLSYLMDMDQLDEARKYLVNSKLF